MSFGWCINRPRSGDSNTKYHPREQQSFEERAESNASFAGQSIPVLDNLDICPCCHEFAPMRDKSLRHKITHMKQCIKRRGMSMQSLLQKLQWIQWDYMPERRNNNKPPPPPPPTARRMPQTVIQATRSAADFRGSSSHGINNSSYMDNDDDDDDFVDSVIVHRKTIQEQQSKRARRNDNSEQDAMDEELQLALTLSRTEAQQNKRD
ncbi:hypothetical protein BDB00DRAFT_791725 [Zychaea mexicana]|uniref:uncharacterized protein n=1 Tax=Zychaea mexicana TaxID=64656 RepID=UPI0022FDCF52|nr:uncharacterized protein BDB00DRAFT_791725 [Zychaea mexicana]KAI9488657.1 hypothetical protein BDB00DRAFT_791725 [Zychaea mexicana]